MYKDYKELNRIRAGEITYKNEYCRNSESEEMEDIIFKLVHGENLDEDDCDDFDRYSNDKAYRRKIYA